MLKGIGASKGIGIGTIIKIEETELNITDKPVSDKDKEYKRFTDAMDAFIARTLAMAENMKSRVGEKEAEILEGHVQIIQDPSILDGVKDGIEQGLCAERAFCNVCQMFIDIFQMSEDELTSQRVTDIIDIQTRMLKILLQKEDTPISEVPAGTILAAKDLTPSMTVGIQKEHVTGILTEEGGYTSHSAILARALGIPAVLSLPNIMEQVLTGQEAILDGDDGVVILSPDKDTKALYQKKAAAFKEQQQALQHYKGKATTTADNEKVELVCNIGRPEDVNAVIEQDGEGIGLFRTEFLFMDRSSVPTEEEQFTAYKDVAEKMQGKPVIIRTLDVGGDKEIPYLSLKKEENPFLGYRAIRVCLNETDMYKQQLRALLRASAFGNIRIMVPMVTCVKELQKVKKLIAEIKKELIEKNIPFDDNILVGVMIETPAAVLIADLLAKEADFFSIGTNDLTQYVMAVDRGNAQVANLYSPYNPAVLRAIKQTIAAGKKEGILVGMCGEAAADPLLIPLFLAYGLQEFSVSATSVLATRATISKWTMDATEDLAKQVAGLSTKEEVKRCLEQAKRY